MVGKNNRLVRRQKNANRIKTYAIKRLSVGVASVAVASGLIFTGDAQLVSAQVTDSSGAVESVESAENIVDENADSTESQTQGDEEELSSEVPESNQIENLGTENLDTNDEQTQANNVDSEVTDPSQTDIETTENADITEEQTQADNIVPETSESNQINNQETIVSDREQDTNLGQDSSPNIQNNTDQTLQEKITSEAIYSPGEKNQTYGYHGTAYYYNNKTLNTTPNQDRNNKPASGENVYLQWLDRRSGYVSPVFYTTSRPDGSFSIDLSKNIVDEFGRTQKFDIAGDLERIAIRTWADSPDPAVYSVVKPGDQFIGFHKNIERTNEVWEGVANISKIYNSQVAFQERPNLGADWLHKPQDEWSYAPNSDQVWEDKGNYGSINGNIWYETGDIAAALAHSWNDNPSLDPRGTGIQVVASYVNDEVARQFDAWKEENKDTNYTLYDFREAQKEIVSEYQAENGIGSHIAETVVGTVDANGEYYIPFRGLYGIDPYQANSGLSVSYTISDEEFGQLVPLEDADNHRLMRWNGTIGQKHRHINSNYMYVAPLVEGWNVYSTITPMNMFGPADDVGGSPAYVAHEDASHNIWKANFAVVASQPMHYILEWNTSDNYAPAGAQANNVSEGLLPSTAYKIQWFKDGNPIGNPTNVTSDEHGKIPSVPITVDPQLAAPVMYTSAIFADGANSNDLGDALAADSFIAAPKVFYEPTVVRAGNEANTEEPVFTDINGETYTIPADKTPSFELLEVENVVDEQGNVTRNYTPFTTINVGDQEIAVSVNSQTGVITIPAEETEKIPGQTITVPVTVSYDNGLKQEVLAEIQIKDFANKEYQPKYEPAETAPETEVTIPAPTFTKEDGTELPAGETVKLADSEPFKIVPADGETETITGATIDPNTGEITYTPASGVGVNEPELVKIPVEVTYEDGSKDVVEAEVTVGEDVYDRGNDETIPVPEGYTRVIFRPGDHGTIAEGISTVFDVKDGSALDANKVPTVTANEGYKVNDVQPWNPEIPAAYNLPEGQTTNTVEHVAQYEVTDASTHTVEYAPETTSPEVAVDLVPTITRKDENDNPVEVPVAEAPLAEGEAFKIVPAEGETETVPGATINPETGVITYTPEADIAKDGPVTVTIPVEVTYEDESKDVVEAKVTVGEDVYDRGNDETIPVPEGYTRVVFRPGDNGTIAEGVSTVFDVKDGSALDANKVPTVTANEGYKVNDVQPWNPEIPAAYNLPEGQTTNKVEHVAQYVEIDASTPAVFNPVTEGDTEITGKAEPNSEVKVTLPNDQEVTVTSDDEGNFKVDVPADVDLNPGDVITGVVTEEGKTPSEPTTVTVGEKEQLETPVQEEQSQPATFDPVTEGDDTITGTAEPGSEVTVTLPNGEEITVTTGDDGKFTVDVPADVDLNPGDVITGVVTEEGKTPSEPTTITVAEQDQSQPAQVDPVTEGDETITGTAEPGSEVTVTLPNGEEVTVTTGDDGKFTVDVPANVDLKPGDEITVVVTEEGKKPSEPTVVKVAEKDQSEPAQVDPITEGDDKITGTAEPGSEVTVTLPNGEEVTVTTGDDGKFTVDVPADVDLKPGDEITVVVTEEGKKPSEPTVVKVAEKDQSEPAQVDPITEGDDTITGTAEPGSEVTVTLPNGEEVTVTTGDDGKFTVDVPADIDLKPGDEITVVVTEEGKKPSEPTVVKVAEQEQSQPAQVDPVTEGDETITGTAEPGSEVTVTLPNGEEVTVTTGDDGKFTVDVPADIDLKPGDEITVVVTEEGKKPSEPTVVKVAEQEQSRRAKVDPITAGDETVTGTAEPGSEVTVTLPNGDEVIVKTGDDGKFVAEVPSDVQLKTGDKVTVVVVEPGKKASEPVTVIVAEKVDPSVPAIADTPGKPAAKVEKAKAPVKKETPSSPEAKTLPKTGVNTGGLAGLAAVSVLTGLGLVAGDKKKRDKDEA